MADSSPNSLQDKSSDRIAISRAELSLLILLVVVGMGLWVWVDREVNALLAGREPREEQIKAEFSVSPQQEKVLLAASERKAIGKELIQARLEQSKQGAITVALAEAFPELTRPPVSGSNSTIPAETAQAYREARVKELIASRLVHTLSERLESVEATAAQSSATLEQSRHSANTKFRQRHALYSLIKRLLAFASSLVIMLLLILIVRRFVAPGEGKRFIVRSPLTFLLVIGALFVLFAYQAFELAGAALVGVVVLLVLFRYIPWPLKVAPVAQADKEIVDKK